MSYNKRAHLQTNIEAIRIAFTLDREKRRATESEQAVLRQYSGFGGLKCILNPAQTESDRAYGTKSDSDFVPMVSELHGLIRENSLVSAIRLPNNLMSDNAGTEVRNDLIVL
jgi:hypothetical protein